MVIYGYNDASVVSSLTGRFCRLSETLPDYKLAQYWKGCLPKILPRMLRVVYCGRLPTTISSANETVRRYWFHWPPCLLFRHRKALPRQQANIRCNHRNFQVTPSGHPYTISLWLLLFLCLKVVCEIRVRGSSAPPPTYSEADFHRADAPTRLGSWLGPANFRKVQIRFEILVKYTKAHVCSQSASRHITFHIDIANVSLILI